ncbi:MAG: TetR/AcrR family transcriptional regulator [Actinomycetota bacterium]|nr:TetR/AcrR family transcriptional regulator [Actinomycetota bacterium]
MPMRRRELAEWRRQQILDAALLVFGSKGVDAASMKDVAAAAGVTSGLLYHYFTSKEALSLAVTVERGFLSDLRELLSGAGERPALVVLPEVTAGFDRMLSQRAALVGLFMSGAANPKIRQGLEEVLNETHRLLGKYLSDRVTAGELRPHDSRAVVQALFSSCAFGHIIGQPVDPAAVAQIVLDGITAAPRAGDAHRKRTAVGASSSQPTGSDVKPRRTNAVTNTGSPASRRNGRRLTSSG